MARVPAGPSTFQGRTILRIDAHPTPRLVSLSSLQPHPDNPNRGDVDSVRESMRVNGVWGEIVVQKSTRYILKGHHTVAALQAEGVKRAWVQFIDVDDVHALEVLVGDNRAREHAGTDLRLLRDALARVLEADDTLDGTGYPSDTLGQIDHVLEALREGTNTPDAATVEHRSLIAMAVPPDTYARFVAIMERMPGDTDAERLMALLKP